MTGTPQHTWLGNKPMAELLGLVLRGLIEVLGHAAAAINVSEAWMSRKRRKRLAALGRG